MTLTWYGLSSFKIVSTGGSPTIVTDPFSKETGLTPPRGAADIVLISRDEDMYSEVSGITGDPLVIKNPGEFDYKEVAIQGIPDTHQEGSLYTIYRIKVDDITLGFLGAITANELSDDQLEELGNIDVLIVPIGGKGKVTSWEDATHIVQQVEPRYVVPSFFDQKGLSFDLDGIEKFSKEISGEAQTEDRLTLKSKDLSGDNIQLVILNPQR